jgi:hypothetical protein
VAVAGKREEEAKGADRKRERERATARVRRLHDPLAADRPQSVAGLRGPLTILNSDFDFDAERKEG